MLFVFVVVLLCVHRTYAVRVAERAAGEIPPGYVLEKDLLKRARDEVDAVNMDAIFKHMGTKATSYWCSMTVL